LLEELRQAAAEDYQQEAELVRAAVRDYLRARERTKREGG
jgi:hypothetical protein